MRVENAATAAAAAAAQTIFNLFFLSRRCRPTFADVTHTHHWPRRLSWGFFMATAAAALPSHRSIALPQAISPSPSIVAISAPIYAPWSWTQDIAVQSLRPVCLHANPHLGISFAFCSFFERSPSPRPMVASTCWSGTVIYFYIFYFSFAHACNKTCKKRRCPEKTNKR